MKQTVSIIIVNYNGRHHLKECLDSIALSDAAGAEIIIVDNASQDGSVEYLNREYPSVRILPLDGNYGFAEANNRGVQAASGEYILFLNNDTVVTADWAHTLLDTLTADPSVGAAGSKLMLHASPGKLNSAGAVIVFNGGGYDIGFLDDDGDKYNISGPRGAVCAASMMVRKSEFLEMGGFDQRYFMYFEDLDLCWRYWLRGFKVMYAPASVVRHKFGGTSGASKHALIRVYYGTRNALFNVVKNYEFLGLWGPLGFNVLYHGAKLLLLLATLRIRAAGEIVRAYGSFIRQLPAVLNDRKQIQSGRTVRDAYLRENGYIVSAPVALREALRLYNT